MNRPVLLLITGMLNDAGVWDAVADELRPLADIRIVVPVEDTIAATARVAWALLADLPPELPLLIAGYSMGGYVAVEMLARPLRSIQAAALVSTSPRPETPESAVGRERTIAAMRKDFARAVQAIVQLGTHQPPPALTARLTTMMMGVGADTAIRQNRAIMGRSDHRVALAALTIPVAVLCGEHDRITPPELSRELAALIPQARLELVAAAGHQLPLEQPHAVTAALRRLLTPFSTAPQTTTETRP